MATRGYAATSISDIRKACGLPPSSIYWHFGSKEGVLAAVMQRGADRFFAAIPTSEDVDGQLAVLSTLQSHHPDFLRLFYMLWLERNNDPAVAAVIRRVRDTAIRRFRDAIATLLPADVPAAHADRVGAELTAVAVGRGVLRRAPRTRRHRHRSDVPPAVPGGDRPYSDSLGGEVNTKTTIITGASSGLGLECTQWPAAISRLTIEHIHISDEKVLLRLGDEPVVLPEPVAALALGVVTNRHGKAAVGDPGTSPWLFPGGQPGRPISPYALTERLRQLGLQPARDRSTALFQLATDLPAALLARMLGIHISVEVFPQLQYLTSPERVTETRTRAAVEKLIAHQYNGSGRRPWRQAAELLDSEHARHRVGQIAVPFGICAEPLNVQAGGTACPYRMRCVGCGHFRTDASFLPELRAYLDRLLADRERVLAATDIDDWARVEATPSDAEISKIRHLIHHVEHDLEELNPADEEQINQASRYYATAASRYRLELLRFPRPALTSERLGGHDCLESRSWQVFAVEVGLFGGVVVEGLVGSDGVVDDAEVVGFHVEGVAVGDVAAVEVFVFEGAEETPLVWRDFTRVRTWRSSGWSLSKAVWKVARGSRDRCRRPRRWGRVLGR